MIMPAMHDHIGFLRHVTIYAQGSSRADRMMVMERRVVFSCRMLMATRASLVALVFEFGRMWIMAVRAFDVFAKHLALQK